MAIGVALYKETKIKITITITITELQRKLFNVYLWLLFICFDLCLYACYV